MASFERSVLRSSHRGVQQGMTPAASREAADAGGDAGDFAATDPFLALMEDWFPRGVFGKHPHRGIETMLTSSRAASTTTTTRAIAA